MKKILLFLFAIILTHFSYADILTLLNGQSFEGRVQKIKNCSIVFKCEKEKYFIPSDSIFSIEFADQNDPVYTDYVPMAGSDACLKGTLDAQQFHGKGGLHLALGFLFGPFAVIGAALSNPNPYRGRDTVMLSKNRDSFSDPIYLQCYKRKARRRNVGHAFMGWGIVVVIAIVSNS